MRPRSVCSESLKFYSQTQLCTVRQIVKYNLIITYLVLKRSLTNPLIVPQILHVFITNTKGLPITYINIEHSVKSQVKAMSSPKLASKDPSN